MAVLPFRLLTAATTGLSFSTSVCPSRQHRVAGGGGRFLFSSLSCRAAAAGRPITVTGDPPTFVSAPGRRIVAVGDLHGDLYQTRAALVMAGVLSPEFDGHVWTGGQTVNGNHETMNVEGDFRYVDPGSFDECIRFLEYLEEFDGNWNDAFLNWVDVSQRWKEEYRASPNADWLPLNFVKKQKGFAARTSLFKKGGQLACELARHPVVLNINDWIFCHGGLLPHHGSSEDSDDSDLPFIATRGYDSIVWTRLYSQDSVERTRRSWNLSSVIAEQTLKSVGAKGMVVGHTPQTRGVNCKCDGKVWCVDVGMSYGVLHSRPEVLEIVNDSPRVLKEQRDSYDEMEVLDYL